MRTFHLIEDRVRLAGRRLLRCAIREAVWVAVILALAATGVVFALVGVYQALLLVWPPWGAAAACAGGALGLALIVVLARYAGGSGTSAGEPERTVADAGDALAGDFDDLAERAREAALEQYRRDPVRTLAAAAAVGAIIGFLGPRTRD